MNAVRFATVTGCAFYCSRAHKNCKSRVSLLLYVISKHEKAAIHRDIQFRNLLLLYDIKICERKLIRTKRNIVLHAWTSESITTGFFNAGSPYDSIKKTFCDFRF